MSSLKDMKRASSFSKLIRLFILPSQMHNYMVSSSLFYLCIKCPFFGLFCCQSLGYDQQFWVAINNLMINQPFINGADWCNKQSNVNGLLHTSFFFLQLLNCSQNVNHSPSYITPLSSFKSNLPGSEAIQKAVDLSGEEDSLLFYTWGMSRAAVMKYRKSHQRLAVSRVALKWWNYYCHFASF